MFDKPQFVVGVFIILTVSAHVRRFGRSWVGGRVSKWVVMSSVVPKFSPVAAGVR